MVDFGKIPRTVISAVTRVCGLADTFVKRMKDTSWADNVANDDLPIWEQFLNIYSAGLSDDARRTAILAYLNANGSPRVEWFYSLAARLGYQSGVFRYGIWHFGRPYLSSAVYFSDGEFLPFRTDISMSADDGTGDKVYDNIDYGATTCVCYYRRGNAANDLSLQLKDLISVARNIGTKILFVDTEK